MVVPQWELKDTPVIVNPSYAAKIENLQLTEEEIRLISQEYLQVDNWVGADENLKKWFF